MNPILIEVLAILVLAFFVVLYEICTDDREEWFAEEIDSIRNSTPLAILVHQVVTAELN